MPWYGKYEEETNSEKLERRIKKLEEEKRQRDSDDNFTMKSKWCGNED